MKLMNLLLAGLASWALVACRDSHAPHEHEGHAEGHHHVAPHGGTLIELGEHTFNVELVRDLEAGKLTAYVLDAHAESFVRLAIPSFEIVLGRSGQPEIFKLLAVENFKTGEKVGDTSQFEVQADWLKEKTPLAGEIKELDIRGNKFSGIKFQIPVP